MTAVGRLSFCIVLIVLLASTINIVSLNFPRLVQIDDSNSDNPYNKHGSISGLSAKNNAHNLASKKSGHMNNKQVPAYSNEVASLFNGFLNCFRNSEQPASGQQSQALIKRSHRSNKPAVQKYKIAKNSSKNTYKLIDFADADKKTNEGAKSFADELLTSYRHGTDNDDYEKAKQSVRKLSAPRHNDGLAIRPKKKAINAHLS